MPSARSILFPRPRGLAGLLVLAWALLLAADGRALIFYSTGDPGYHTTAPGGSLADSGWQWTGTWVGFQAVPIGPHHFIAARHINGQVGDPFLLNGVYYPTVSYVDDTSSDLRIWQINGTFPSWAPLYRTSDEVGKSFVVFGRGVIRGAEIRVGGVLKGWQWAGSDGQLRWGQNTFVQSYNGGSYWGRLLYATFDQGGGSNECDLGVGDSSGPVFINDGSGWKLAGLGAAVDSYFNTTDSGSGFSAAIFDARGLYYSPDNGASSPWQLVADNVPDPTGFFITPISPHQAWIDSVLPPPDSADAPLLSPAQLAAFAALLALAGAWALRGSAART